MSWLEKTTPSSVSALITTSVSVPILFASRHAGSSPPVAIFLENVVTNAVESAPSANRSRSRFGARNAVMNMSRFPPAPKSELKIISRASPSRRLHMTAMPTTPAARVLERFVSEVVVTGGMFLRVAERASKKSTGEGF